MNITIAANVPSDVGMDEQWISGDDICVFVGIDVVSGLVRVLSARLPSEIVFEIGRCISYSGSSYPSFHFFREDKTGNVLWRKYISKSTGDWIVEDG